METNKSLCELCSSPAKKVCSGCRAVAYCSAEHQVKMWKFHRHLCAFSHLDFIRQPFFEVEEARGLLCAFGQKFEVRNMEKVTRTQIKNWQDSDSAIVKHHNKVVKETFKVADELGRTLEISMMRALARSQLTAEQLSSLLARTSLLPFYIVASLQTTLHSIKSNYHLPYVRELFNFSCVLGLLAVEEKADINTIRIFHGWLMIKFKRLEKITSELEKEGKDLGGIYRACLEAPIIQLASFDAVLK